MGEAGPRGHAGEFSTDPQRSVMAGGGRSDYRGAIPIRDYSKTGIAEGEWRSIRARVGKDMAPSELPRFGPFWPPSRPSCACWAGLADDSWG
jgi:hypothetical protein